MQHMAKVIVAIVIIIGGGWFYFSALGFWWGIGIPIFFLLASIAKGE